MAAAEQQHHHGSRSDPHLAHHFDTAAQQFESGRLGMWLFLATEILLFGGLFCVYAVYRANHPDIFIYAHKYLDKPLGALNTAILICSSLSMAWAVRCAQLNRQRGLVILLSITLMCACGFLSIKYVEYQHKWKHGLLWGEKFAPTVTPPEAGHGEGPGGAPEGRRHQAPAEHQSSSQGSDAESPVELASRKAGALLASATSRKRPSNVHIFFGIYFLMTGLHAIHVIAGMIIISWILVRSLRGDFNSNYFTPVDLAGLYWHLVDLIWIYLFPLLYLIH